MGHIIWIASYPQSGDTWVRLFLNNLVLQEDEPHDISDLNVITPPENAGAFYQPFFDRPLGQVSMAELAEKRPFVHRALAERIEGYVFVKTHFLVARHLGTETVTPEATAGAIYIVRNPLDVAVSYSDFGNRDIDETIDHLNRKGLILQRNSNGSYQLAGSWSENVESWTRKANERLHVVKYEDLIDDPMKHFTAMVRFLAMDASKEQIEKAIAQSSTSVRRQIEKTKRFRESPDETIESFRANLKDQWQKRLTTAQVSALVGSHLQTMLRFGYWQ